MLGEAQCQSRAEENENPFRSKHFGPHTPASMAPPGYTRPGALCPCVSVHPCPLPTQSCVVPASPLAASRLGDGFSPAQLPQALPSRCQTNPISAPSPQPASSQQRWRISRPSTPPTKQNTAKRTQMAATASHQWLSINGVPAIHRFRPRGKARKQQTKIRAKPGKSGHRVRRRPARKISQVLQIDARNNRGRGAESRCQASTCQCGPWGSTGSSMRCRRSSASKALLVQWRT